MIELDRSIALKALYLNANSSGTTGNDFLVININGVIDSIGEHYEDFYALFCVDNQSIEHKVKLLADYLAGVCIIKSNDDVSVLVEMLDMDLSDNSIATMSNGLYPLINEHNGYVPYMMILEMLMVIPWFNSQRFTDFQYLNSIIYALDCEYTLINIWYDSDGDILYQFDSD